MGMTDVATAIEQPAPPLLSTQLGAASLQAVAIAGAVPAVRLELADTHRLTRPTLLQGMQPFQNGYLLAQAWKIPHGDIRQPPGIQSSVFNRYDADGRFRSRMICVTAGHCSTFSTSGPYVWLGWQKVDPNGDVTQRRIARVRWRRGVVHDDDPDITFYDPHTHRSVTPYLDLDHGRIGLREVDAEHRETYTLHDLDAFKRGIDEPLARVQTTSRSTFQGWGCYGDRLWILRGATWKPARLDEFRWGEDERVGRLELTPELKAVKATSYEPEGVWVSRALEPVLHIGARFGSTSKRRFLSFRVTELMAPPPAVPGSEEQGLQPEG